MLVISDNKLFLMIGSNIERGVAELFRPPVYHDEEAKLFFFTNGTASDLSQFVRYYNDDTSSFIGTDEDINFYVLNEYGECFCYIYPEYDCYTSIDTDQLYIKGGNPTLMLAALQTTNGDVVEAFRSINDVDNRIPDYATVHEYVLPYRIKLKLQKPTTSTQIRKQSKPPNDLIDSIVDLSPFEKNIALQRLQMFGSHVSQHQPEGVWLSMKIPDELSGIFRYCDDEKEVPHQTKYVVTGITVGAGTLKGNVIVTYANMVSGESYSRTKSDFTDRMVAVENNQTNQG